MKCGVSTLTCVILCLVTGADFVRAGLIVDLKPAVNLGVDGFYTYSYTLADDLTSTAAVISFRLDVDPTSDLRTPSGPTGWDIFYNPGEPIITWESSDIPFDLQPGASVSFTFSSLVGPFTTGYAILGDDGVSFPFLEGQTIGPVASAVPEPSTLVLSFIGTCNLLGYTALRGRRPPSPDPGAQKGGPGGQGAARAETGTGPKRGRS